MKNSRPHSAPTGTSKGATQVRGVLVVDDHPVLREGLVQIIDQEPDLKVRAQADTSPLALDLIRRTRVDVAIVDISLAGSTNGIELTKSIKSEHPNLPVLVLSMHDESFYAERALKAGARGYLMKREASESIITALRAVLAGEIFLSREMEKSVLKRIGGTEAGKKSTPLVAKLTDREAEVLQLFGEGRYANEIAAALHISQKTVDAHRANIKKKLEIRDSRELTRYATSWVNSQSSNPPARLNG